MHLHILGICGTFMGGVAALAKAAGHTVSGSDDNAWPPMSTQLEQLGVTLTRGDDTAPLEQDPDMVIVGNVMRRGHRLVERMLDLGLPYTSGPAWIAEHVLAGRRVIACAGTHGKTTTSSLVTSLLRSIGRDPGFLIGGIAPELGVSAAYGSDDVFVIEADEYDTAFFDKRAKFVHYRPEVAILANLEFDHADIYPSIDAIARQMHHLVRTVPGRGCLLVPAVSSAIDDVLALGAWTPTRSFGTDPKLATIAVTRVARDRVAVHVDGVTVVESEFSLLGEHNLDNAAAAIAALAAVGVAPHEVGTGLATFGGVKRRLEPLLVMDAVTVYDDFAHHPTAIHKTIAGVRAAEPTRRLLVALEPRSNTMRSGAHGTALGEALAAADRVYIVRPSSGDIDLAAAIAPIADKCVILDGHTTLCHRLRDDAAVGDIVVLMSNGSFGDVRQRLPTELADKFAG
ncbi:MAG: UDP-N-acetylmuramate:L-alanyl-gamma-D-glutamyl-meso-diaminopimelate ligase [Pseudomonadota bacterium]